MSKKNKKFEKKSFVKKVEDNTQVKAKKHLGQHFLKDENIAKQIADTLTLNRYNQVLEIGPGMGVLTKYLLQKDVDVFAMDLDSESIAYLQSHFLLEHPRPAASKHGFEVIEADFLKYDTSQLFGEEPFAITGNFPYNISSQIVFKALELRHQIPEFTGMFQKEVAARICEKEGNKTYGILSVLVQAFYDAEYLFTVPPEVFNPPPKVHSGVLRLIRKDDFSLPCSEKLFFRVVKAAFGLRRKTLRNSLKSFNLSDNLKEDSIFDRRPEQMSVEDFIALTTRIEKDLS
ncbi:16S rRNA (adenine(1518)-N(6)/adenine(1519)-N(6))-dimethyltransferase RsmA [Galbibacter mesophilus]|uniref:16S rRNA (adenine(1518)-N(6)/adenine(1519)-N(6))- dimethyltransferase RsmA n=1 Tax=Galbibacter mesophilus TaxID=379069 RepID=UPI00191DDAFC|nr:16S rRNA (adenine(1518)-N(6)/adenine(1519)-N(6))-dimethyltransferase RsmA [Galbibacter mesophilus]MCM5664246.1 16S rRNA (adenine(1518)-N(6)/adenine(1519)-N(6))-dimethyltransferase RsmA [Galbibacter mesophilus]